MIERRRPDASLGRPCYGKEADNVVAFATRA
jgi:hypothetical protein